MSDYTKKVENLNYRNINSINNHYRIKDYCKEFEFKRLFDSYNFNQEINRLIREKGFDPSLLIHDGSIKNDKDNGYNLTTLLYRELENVIQKNTNLIIGIEGETDTSKSYSAIRIAEIAKELHKSIKNKEKEIFTCWNFDELLDNLKKSNAGDIFIMDEGWQTTGKGSRIQGTNLMNLLSGIRYRENLFIFIDPLGVKIKLCNLYLRAAGINYKEKIARFLILSSNRNYLGHVYIGHPKDEKFLVQYDIDKKKANYQLRHNRGAVNAKIVDAQFVSDRNEELDYTENFLIDNYPEMDEKKKMKYIEIYIRHEKGESFGRLAKPYGYSNASGPKYVHDKINSFLETTEYNNKDL